MITYIILLFIIGIIIYYAVSKKQIRLLEFIEDKKDGKFSSQRLMGFLTVFAVIVDWMHAVFYSSTGIWSPTWQTIVFVLIVLGFKFAQKVFSEGKKWQ